MFTGRKRGLFGAPMMGDAPWTTPPFVPQDRTSPSAGPIVPASVTPTYKKPDTKHMIAGVIGDTLAQIGGGQASFLSGLARQKEVVAKAQADAADRTADFAGWQQKEEWKLAHPAPVNNDTSADYDFITSKLGKDAADKWLGNMGDPLVTVQLPGDRVYNGPRSGLAAAMGAGAAPPRAPVGRLTPIQGGTAPQAPSPFRTR
ncbi:MAG: hypothetical protein ACOYBT_09920 [Polynucleobacter sp.]